MSQTSRHRRPGAIQKRPRRRQCPRVDLPTLTYAHLRVLTRAAADYAAIIRGIGGAYLVELDIGSQRWVLISTHRKQPRLFQRLESAATAVRRLGAHRVILELDDGESGNAGSDGIAGGAGAAGTQSDAGTVPCE